MASGLVIDAPGVLVAVDGDPVGDAGRNWLGRMALARVPVVVVAPDEAHAVQARLACGKHPPALMLVDDGRAPFPRPQRLLQAVAEAGLDPFTTWLITCDPAAVRAAGAAGLVGAVLIGAGEPPAGVACTIGQARDLADAPRVMIPPEGGCWHDHG